MTSVQDRLPPLEEQVAGWAPAPVRRTGDVLPEPAERLADLLGAPLDRAADGLPLLWQWVQLLPWPSSASLGTDGHPVAGDFLPPLADRRRMIAGGRCSVDAPLEVGREAAVERSLARAEVKRGRSGALLLVTVRSEFSQSGRVCVREEQDLVYRSGPVERRAGAADDHPDPERPELPGASFTADPVLLFRFSALTQNAHRIHYDQPYATAAEGYPGLVVHGPLLALLMAEHAHRTSGLRVQSIDFRFRRPVFVGEQVTVVVTDAARVGLSVLGPGGDVRATATAVLGDGR